MKRERLSDRRYGVITAVFFLFCFVLAMDYDPQSVVQVTEETLIIPMKKNCSFINLKIDSSNSSSSQGCDFH